MHARVDIGQNESLVEVGFWRGNWQILRKIFCIFKSWRREIYRNSKYESQQPNPFSDTIYSNVLKTELQATIHKCEIPTKNLNLNIKFSKHSDQNTFFKNGPTSIISKIFFFNHFALFSLRKHLVNFLLLSTLSIAYGCTRVPMLRNCVHACKGRYWAEWKFGGGRFLKGKLTNFKKNILYF